MEEVKRTELEKKIDILEDDIADISPEILRLLLKDKTTKKNILWCTKDYEAYGYEFNEWAEMKVELITGVYFNVIQPRAAKSKEVQERRIRKRAEVFTPSWICNEQNNQVDEAWFGKPNVFNTPDGTYWITAKDKIQQDFTKRSDIDWTKSVHDIDLQLYKKYGLSDEEIAFIESKVKPMDGTSYYESMLKMSYQDIVSALLKKYGSAKHNYFKDTACKIKNPLVTRTNEGLFCHHIDEDKAIMLCNDKFAANNPFEYQKADRLVYCNLLEHLLLHVKIAENPNPDANENELPGIGGAINFICKDLNDIYSGKEFADEWRKNIADKVKDNFDDYIIILRYLWNVVEKNPVYKAIITKEMLCVGWNGKVVKEVMNALNANE